MIPLILTMGCMLFLCIGVVLASFAGVKMQEDGPNIEKIIMFLAGIGIVVFACFCMVEAVEYYHEKESPKTEITTSIPAQIDTVITIRNSVPDTSYIYKFNPNKK